MMVNSMYFGKFTRNALSAVDEQMRRFESIVRDQGYSWTVAAIDVTNFSLVSALLGDDEADKLLEAIDRFLASDVGATWTQTGADIWVGFQVCERSDDAVSYMQKMRDSVSRIANDAIMGYFEIHIAAGVCSGRSTVDLLTKAFQACRIAKTSKTGFALFDPDRLSEQSPLIKSLASGRGAQDHIQLVRQRIVHRDGGGHFEILSRTKSHSIASTIALVERLRFACEFDRSVVDMATRQVERSGMQHAINISAQTACTPKAVDQIIEQIGSARCFAIEITESSVLSDTAIAVRTIEKFRNSGIDVYLDDYGDGATTLAMLDMPFTCIKLGQHLSGDGCSADVLGAVVGLANSRNLPVIAEMVETESQYKRLLDVGVFGFQGWLFHRPEPILRDATWSMSS